MANNNGNDRYKDRRANGRRPPAGYYDDDDDVEADTLGNVLGLEDKLGVGKDRYGNVTGTVTLLGKKWKVGPKAAMWVDGAISQGLDWVSDLGAAPARNISVVLAKQARIKGHHAARIGEGVEWGWRLFWPSLQLLLGIKTAVKDGFKSVNDLKDEAAIVIAANNNMKVGVGGVLASNFSVLRNQRALIMKEARSTLLSSFAKSVQNLPTVILSIWRYKLGLIDDLVHGQNDRTSAMLDPALTDNDPRKIASQEKVDALWALSKPKVIDPKARKQDKITAIFSSMVHPQDITDLETNRDYGRFAPIVGGIISGAISENIQKNVGETPSAWRKIIALKNSIATQGSKAGSDIEESVMKIFEQHAEDMGIKNPPAGPKFNAIVEEVSAYIMGEGQRPRLPVEILAEILDDKEIIPFPKNGMITHYGSIARVQAELEKLSNKYTPRVSRKEFYEDVPFTEQEAANVFESFDKDDDAGRAFFVTLFKRGALDGVISEREQNEYRAMAKDYFIDEITTFIENMLKAQREELEKIGVSDDLIDELKSIEHDFRKATRQGRPNKYVEDNREYVSEIVRDILVTTKEPDELWQNYVKPQRDDEVTQKDSEEARLAGHRARFEEKSRLTKTERYKRDNRRPEEHDGIGA